LEGVKAGFLVHKDLNKFQELSKETRLGELNHVYLCFGIITWIIAWLCMLFAVYYFGILCFWKIPINRLAGDELPPNDAYGCAWFSGFRVEPHGGINWTTRRCLLFNPILGFLDEGLGGGDWPTRRRELSVRF